MKTKSHRVRRITPRLIRSWKPCPPWTDERIDALFPDKRSWAALRIARRFARGCEGWRQALTAAEAESKRLCAENWKLKIRIENLEVDLADTRGAVKLAIGGQSASDQDVDSYMEFIRDHRRREAARQAAKVAGGEHGHQD